MDINPYCYRIKEILYTRNIISLSRLQLFRNNGYYNGRNPLKGSVMAELPPYSFCFNNDTWDDILSQKRTAHSTSVEVLFGIMKKDEDLGEWKGTPPIINPKHKGDLKSKFKSL